MTGLSAVLSACGGTDLSSPLRVSISSPAVGQTVSGTYQVQVDVQDPSKVAKITVYARGRGNDGPGVVVGSATSAPFVVSWYTPAQPNLADLDLTAEAEDTSGKRHTSAAVAVRTSNPNAPTLSYLVAYSLPPSSAALNATSLTTRVPFADPLSIQPPAGSVVGHPAPLKAQDTKVDGQEHVLEWAWQPVPSAKGYRLWQAGTDVAGPYANVFNQLATTGTQKFSRNLPEANVGQTYSGVVTALVGEQEGIFSNAAQATFLSEQKLNFPASGEVSTVTRPNFGWLATPGVTGYLWFLSRKPQAVSTAADWVCTNSPQSTDQLTLAYPAACPALTAGIYHWWVSGVAFNQQRIVNGLTFSADRTLEVK